ncbi:AhpC/TSA antioxidant enzyme-domain-containing protein, partial [Crepidotus variabilis]
MPTSPSKQHWHASSGPEYALPTVAQITHAASLPLYGEEGRQVRFGSLFEARKTIVVFIRHFWCPLCQDYMTVVSEVVKPDMLERGHERVDFIIISNGAHGMITKYRQMFKLPFKIYTDPTLALYKALGMGKDGSKGYVKHGLMSGIAMVVVRAIKVGMPVWEKGGDVGQLGGEFVFGPGLTCSFAHRMQTTKGHAPIQEVLQAA